MRSERNRWDNIRIILSIYEGGIEVSSKGYKGMLPITSLYPKKKKYSPMISGAKYSGVPQTVYVLSDKVPLGKRKGNFLAKPKSITLR